MVKYEYAVNNSDLDELYRRTIGASYFKYIYLGWASTAWCSADEDTWSKWVTVHGRPIPDSYILLKGLHD